MAENTRTVRHPDINVPLVGQDGNAFAIMGRVRSAMKRAKLPAEEVEAFTKEATAGDYDHLLQTVMSWVSTSSEGDEDDD